MSDIGITLRGNHSALNASLQKAGSDVKKFGDDATKSLRGVQDETRNLHKTMSALGGQMGTALTAAFVVNKVADFTHAIIDAQTNLDKLHNTLSFSLGAGPVTGQMEYLRKTTNALGLEFGSTAVMYAKFSAAARGTSMEGRNTQKVFESIGKASTVMGLSAADTQGVMLALTQILSKGTTQAEEIRGQLGERLPGAFAIASRAMGVTTQEFSKMLELGQVVSADFLPKFAAQMEKEVAGSFDKASHSMQASLNRMSNAWLEFKQTVAQSGAATAIAAEVNGLTNYMALLTETMQQARANGASAVGEISAALGTMIARAPFDVLAFSSNTLNGTLNLLSMGALKLNTNVDTLPAVFDTAAQRAAALDGNLLAAEKNLTQLRAKLDQVPDNIYLKSETHQAWLLVQELRAAKAAKDGLSGNTGPGNVSGIAAQYPTRSQSYAADAERVNKIRAGYEAVQQGLSGVSANYLKNLAALKAGFDEGLTTQEQYTKDVIALIDKETGFKKTSAKAQKDAHKELESQAKLLADLSGLTDSFTQDWDRLSVMFAKGTLSLTDLTAAQAALLAKQPIIKAGIDDEKKARDELLKTRDAELKAHATELASLGDKAQKLEDEVAMYGLSKEAIEELTTARMLDRIEVLKGFDNSAEEISRIEQVIAARKRLATAGTVLDAKDASKKAAEQMVKDQKKAAEESGKYWTDALMRAFESGKGFFESLWDTIKNTLKTEVLQVGIRATMGSMGLGAAGAASAGSSALSGASSGLSLLSNGASIASLGSAFTGAFSAGAAIGTEAFGAGMTMMAEASGVSSFMAGAGQALGAMGPAGWAALAAVAVLALAGNNFVSASGTGYGTRAYDAKGKSTTSTIAGDGGVTATVDGVLSGMYNAYASQARALGIAVANTSFTYGSNTGRQGENPNFTLASTTAGNSYTSTTGDPGLFGAHEVKMTPENLQLEMSRAVLTALQSSALPKYLQGAFDGITIGKLTQENIDAWYQGANAITAFHNAMQAAPWENFKSLSFSAIQNLAGFAGGLDKLQASLGSFYDNFYAADVKTANLTKQTSTAFAALGETMPAADAGMRDWYRSLVESKLALDQNIPANALVTNSVLALQDAVNTLAPAFDNAAKSTEALTASVEKTVTSAFSELRDLVQSAESDLVDAFNRASATLSATVDRFGSIQGIFKDFADSISSSGSAGQSLAYLRGEFTRLSDLARLGDAGAASKAVGVGDQLVAKIMATSSRQQADMALARLAVEAAATASIAEQQKTIAQQQLDALKEVVGKLVDVEGKTLSVEDAMNNLRVLQSVENSSIADAIAGGFGGLLASSSLNLSAVDKSNAAIATGNALSASILSGINTMAGIQQQQEADRLAAARAAEDERLRQSKITALQQTGLSAEQSYQNITASQKTAVGGVKASINDIWSLASAYGLTLQANAGESGNTAQFGVDAGGQFNATYNQISGNASSFAAFKAAFYAPGGVYDRTYGQASVLADLASQVNVASAELERQRELVRALGGVPAFASGGTFAGGLRVVGENGPEIEVTGPSRIYDANQTRSMLGGSGGGSQLEALVQRLIQEVADLRRANSLENNAIATHTSLTSDATRRMDKNGVLVYTDPAEPIKTVAA